MEQQWAHRSHPIICNLYLENFEQMALAKAENSPSWWKRYVDDTYTVLQKRPSTEFHRLL